jgi:hypothetical protein
LEKASSVGAKTVKGPSLARVSTKSAAFTAWTSVWKESLLTAISTIVAMMGYPREFYNGSIFSE